MGGDQTAAVGSACPEADSASGCTRYFAVVGAVRLKEVDITASRRGAPAGRVSSAVAGSARATLALEGKVRSPKKASNSLARLQPIRSKDYVALTDIVNSCAKAAASSRP